MSPSAVIDFQGFRGDRGSFIVKELTIVDTRHGTSWHWFFKPPANASDGCGEKSCNKWVKKNIHDIDWNYGQYRYEDLKTLISDVTRAYDILWCKGLEKCNVLEDLIEQPVYDLHNFNCPNLKSLDDDSITCHYHLDKVNFVCSYNQAHRLAMWIRKHPEAANFKKEEIRRQTYGNISSPHHLLSFNGFIRGYGDQVKCVYCGLIYDINSTTSLFKFHRANNPNCTWFDEQSI